MGFVSSKLSQRIRNILCQELSSISIQGIEKGMEGRHSGCRVERVTSDRIVNLVTSYRQQRNTKQSGEGFGARRLHTRINTDPVYRAFKALAKETKARVDHG